MTELLNCPFCGGEAALDVSKDFKGRVVQAYVYCTVCHADNGIFGNEDYAIEAWNTRAERTCRNVRESYQFFSCSECGAIESDGGAGNYTWDYCPSCGAKVVE